MLPQSRKINFIAAACAAITVLGTLAPACGPFFPNQVIINGDNGVLTMPIGDFVAEMAKLRPSAPSLNSSPCNQKAIRLPISPRQLMNRNARQAACKQMQLRKPESIRSPGNMQRRAR